MKRYSMLFFMVLVLAFGFNTHAQTEFKVAGDGHEELDESNSGGGGEDHEEYTGWFWQSKVVACTVTITVTAGGGPVPASVSRSETWEGTKKTCVDGWTLCWSGLCR